MVVQFGQHFQQIVLIVRYHLTVRRKSYVSDIDGMIMTPMMILMLTNCYHYQRNHSVQARHPTKAVNVVQSMKPILLTVRRSVIFKQRE